MFPSRSILLSLLLLSLSLCVSLPGVFSQCNACSPNPCAQGCVTINCVAHCITDSSARPFDMMLRYAPPSCNTGDVTCYANYVLNVLSSVTVTAGVNLQTHMDTPQPTDDQGISFEGAGTFWGLTGTKFSTAASTADQFLQTLQTHTACSQWSGDGSCPITDSIDNLSAILYINMSSIRHVTNPTTLSFTTCADGTLIDATQSCSSMNDPVFATRTNTNNNHTTQLLIIILPIVGGFTLLLIIASIVVIRRRHAKQQVNSMIQLQTIETSPSTQV